MMKIIFDSCSTLLIIVLAVLALALFLHYRAGFLRYRAQIRGLTDGLAETRSDVSAFNASQRKAVKTVRKNRRSRENAWENEVELTRNGK